MDPSRTERSMVPDAVPTPLRDGLYQAVRAEWVAGRGAHHPQYPPLEHALERLARAARAHEIAASTVLRTLDAICRATAGGDDALNWDHVREWAGRVIIRTYYRSD